MKYTKPHKAIRWLRGESSQWGSDQEADILAFLDSLPAEFEIVEPGMTQVRWPEWLTRRRLEIFAERGSVSERDGALKALAAIAPVEKKRKWNLWIIGGDPRPYAHPPEWTPSDSIGTGWRKVGECEVEA